MFANIERLIKMLNSKDIVVLLKILAIGDTEWTYRMLAEELSMSVSSAHAGLEQCASSHLYNKYSKHPILGNLSEFLIHGVKYVYPAKQGSITRGMPTAHAARPLKAHFQLTEDLPPVWPFAEGKTRGYALEPLHQSVPKAAQKDKKLYELLALVDAIRGGRARERRIAIEELQARLEQA